MNIVVLDGYTLNPGDLNWQGIEQFGSLKIYDRISLDEETIIKAIGKATVVFTNKTPLTKSILQKVPHVTYIGVLATGYNVVDVSYAKELGITVTNIPAYSTRSVAQFTMGLLLEMCHNIGKHNTAVQNRKWINSADFSFIETPLIELVGKTIGIIGFGSIGQATAKLAEAFGLHILVHSRTKYPELETANCRYVPLDHLFEKADIISLHCPLTESTDGIINKNNIAKMKDGVLIINTSRGGLVVEEDLKNALNSGKVASAAVDVISAEPMLENNPLLNAKNCIITPHIAWAPKEARTRLMQTAVLNLEAFLNGNPVNVVNS
ncbi:D-2-hydroxyacid dehydrogenase [Polaribacter sp. Z014]|uniref:D-2-hydroxyacid dehydrogenase n=1 Tax=Polaribacter sp. Z014 TaxID=2927126 RepID=UPI0020208E6D|nr:D-2-hydroxyacid dehydrogenase [Polaribacter sp. Z014]MCL7763456.1 D-2-hydroxyacid dehydrogenase [Polaribacter sp. Z014]